MELEACGNGAFLARGCGGVRGGRRGTFSRPLCAAWLQSFCTVFRVRPGRAELQVNLEATREALRGGIQMLLSREGKKTGSHKAEECRIATHSRTAFQRAVLRLLRAFHDGTDPQGRFERWLFLQTI